MMLGLKAPGGSARPCFLCDVVRDFGTFEIKNGATRRAWPSNRSSFLKKGNPRRLRDWKLNLSKRDKLGIKSDIVPSLRAILDNDVSLAQVVVLLCIYIFYFDFNLYRQFSCPDFMCYSLSVICLIGLLTTQEWLTFLVMP